MGREITSGKLSWLIVQTVLSPFMEELTVLKGRSYNPVPLSTLQ